MQTGPWSGCAAPCNAVRARRSPALHACWRTVQTTGRTGSCCRRCWLSATTAQHAPRTGSRLCRCRGARGARTGRLFGANGVVKSVYMWGLTRRRTTHSQSRVPLQGWSIAVAPPIKCVNGPYIVPQLLSSFCLLMIGFFFPNSRALLPTFRTTCPDGSHFAQNTTTNPCSSHPLNSLSTSDTCQTLI